MAYTTINKSTDYFNTKLYTGNYTDNTNITGVGFQPDLVWLKERSNTSSHLLQDAVRGANKDLFSDLTSAEESNTNRMKAFISDGFTVGQHNLSNQNGETYASWNWKANGAGSANTAGTINSTVSVNTTAGFSIVKYTGNGVANATIGHGLNDTIACIILKNLSDSENWWVYHKGLSNPATKAIQLNSTNAEFTPGTSAFYPTNFSNTLFSVKNDNASNSNGDNYIAYVFAEKTGYSKFGSYIGNGNADGSFVYTGFKPAFVMIKRTDTTSNWTMFDNKRDGFNCDQAQLKPNVSDAEDAGSASTFLDILSNGFKFRNTASDKNGNGARYIYITFAEAPLVGSNNIPCTAR